MFAVLLCACEKESNLVYDFSVADEIWVVDRTVTPSVSLAYQPEAGDVITAHISYYEPDPLGVLTFVLAPKQSLHLTYDGHQWLLTATEKPGPFQIHQPEKPLKKNWTGKVHVGLQSLKFYYEVQSFPVSEGNKSFVLFEKK